MKTRRLLSGLALHVLSASLGLVTTLRAGEPLQTILSPADESFAKHAAAEGLEEATLAGLAHQKAQSRQVRDLAETLLRDQDALNRNLTEVIERRNVVTSAVIDPSGAAAFQHLEKFQGEAFDSAFVDQMQRNYRRSVDRYEEEVKKVEDLALKVYINKALKKLKFGLDQVDRVREQLR